MGRISTAHNGVTTLAPASGTRRVPLKSKVRYRVVQLRCRVTGGLIGSAYGRLRPNGDTRVDMNRASAYAGRRPSRQLHRCCRNQGVSHLTPVSDRVRVPQADYGRHARPVRFAPYYQSRGRRSHSGPTPPSAGREPNPRGRRSKGCIADAPALLHRFADKTPSVSAAVFGDVIADVEEVLPRLRREGDCCHQALRLPPGLVADLLPGSP